MIRFRPRGGLGNQLFGYAAARNIANQHQTELEADLLYLEPGQDRGFQLDTFGSSIHSTKRASLHMPLRLQRLFPLGRVQFEKDFLFDASIFNLKNGVTLDGYFQSWLYFEPIEEALKLEMKNVTQPSQLFQSLQYQIEKYPNCTFVHVRRGDYVYSKFGLVSGKFYARALELIEALDGPQRVVLFSENPEEAESILPRSVLSRCIRLPSMLSLSPIEVVNLMSKTKNAIIANSTFSWWGAWLGYDSSGIVVFPRPWIDRVHLNDRDMHPPGWIGLSRDL